MFLTFFLNRTDSSLRDKIARCEHWYISEAHIRQTIIINFLCLFSRTINQFTPAAVSWLCITWCSSYGTTRLCFNAILYFTTLPYTGPSDVGQL